MEQQRDCDFSVIGHYPTGYAIFERRLLSSKLADPAIKETSFVYQDKRGFFLLSGQNTGGNIENRASERSIGCYGA